MWRTNSEYSKIACHGKPPPGNPDRGSYERERDRGTAPEPFAPESVGRGTILPGDAQGLRARTEARSSCHPTACPGVEAIAQVELAVISVKSALYKLAAYICGKIGVLGSTESLSVRRRYLLRILAQCFQQARAPLSTSVERNQILGSSIFNECRCRMLRCSRGNYEEVCRHRRLS
jgi:hypothetical protein